MGDITIFDINSFLNKYNIKYFCETGTLHGDAVNFISKFSFDKIISIEIVESLATAAVQRFKHDSRINIVLGDSSKVLQTVCETTLNNNTLFWLDAHFPGADNNLTSYDQEKDNDTRVPLKAELQVIQKRSELFEDVIIIDDLWLFEEGPFEWGTFNEHMSKYHNSEKRELICGQDSSFIYNMFNETHNIEKLNSHQGYLVLTPSQKSKL